MIRLTDLIKVALEEAKKAKKKPSAGMTEKEKSAVVKKAKAGKNIGKKGKNFEKVAKEAGGGDKGKAIAAAAMWKGEAKKAKKKHMKECAGCDSDQSQDWTYGHDHEGSMAKSEVKDMIKNAVQLYNMLGENDELPGWISGYITLASDYIHSVTEHLAGKSDEMEGNTMIQTDEE